MDAGNRNVWATLADWNRGTMEGAVGWTAQDVFEDYAVDYDNYKGAADVSKVAVGSDVPATHWAYNGIQALTSKQIVRGDSGTGNVRPDARITREEVATVLLNALNIQPDQTGTLAAGDRSSVWAKDILLTAKARGILAGDQKGNLNGQLTATRAEVAAMIARVASIKNGSDSTLQAFRDQASVPAWARGNLSGMVENKMISGYQDQTIRANAPITRAETFTLISKLLAQ